MCLHSGSFSHGSNPWRSTFLSAGRAQNGDEFYSSLFSFWGEVNAVGRCQSLAKLPRLLALLWQCRTPCVTIDLIFSRSVVVKRQQVTFRFAFAILLAFLSSNCGPAALSAQEAAPDAAAQQLEVQAKQYEQALAPKMWRELEFIRRSCDLSPAQRPKIKAEGLASLQRAAKVFVKQRTQAAQDDPSLAIRQDLHKFLKATLTPEQLAAYEQQIARRAAAAKKLTIQIVVAQLDGSLYLTAEQRDKISQSLAKDWQEKWEQWSSVMQHGDNYFPMIPDQLLLPVLTEQQKRVWSGAQKLNPSFWGGGRRAPNDDVWWDGKDENAPEKKDGDSAREEKS